MNEKSRITADGKERLERTAEYEKNVAELKKEVKNTYAWRLLEERSWIKRLIIRVKIRIEIRRKIAELSSDRNLHLMGDYELR